jgi:hypothetical protein
MNFFSELKRRNVYKVAATDRTPEEMNRYKE